MNKIILACCALLFTSVTAIAQQNEDPVVMTVGGEAVTRSEFEYNFNKNNTDAVVDRKNVTEYADLFAVYKMKVLAALDAKMDTISSFQKEFRHYRDLQVRPLLVPELVVEKQCQDYYNGMLQALDGKDLIFRELRTRTVCVSMCATCCVIRRFTSASRSLSTPIRSVAS